MSMSDAFRRVRRHREAKKQLVEVYDKQDKVIVIHYSCESFYDRQEKLRRELHQSRFAT